MVSSEALYLAFLALLAGERLLELRLSRRNARWARARGGVEYGAAHFRLMQLLHSAFFVGCAAEVLVLQRPFVPPLGFGMTGLALLAQGLRYWAVSTLGRRWNVRVIVIPGEPAVTSGPYRYLRHPNYLAVVLEGFAVPLIHGAWVTALAFSVLNALVLRARVRCEEGALRMHCDYEARFQQRARPLRNPSLQRSEAGR